MITVKRTAFTNSTYDKWMLIKYNLSIIYTFKLMIVFSSDKVEIVNILNLKH